MEKRPNVFPTNTPQPQQNQPVRTDPLAQVPEHNVSVDNDYEAKKLDVASEIYTNSQQYGPTVDAIEAMRKRTEEQLRLRDEMLRKNTQQTENYQEQYNIAKDRKQPEPIQQAKVNSQPISPVANIPTMNTNQNIAQLSQPQFNAAFDVIPLPSEGKIYKNKRPNIRVAYMTTADENILTSPNLLQSGEFLEILINRKLLETDIRYKDLHIGDRNAIMLWLRATSYGEMYPVTIFDEDGNPFETEIDLTSLQVKKLTVDPDEEGLFDFILPLSKSQIKFKLLTVGDIENIENKLEEDEKNEMLINNANTYRLESQIIEVNGDRHRSNISAFVDSMRVRDAKALRDYIDEIESGVELEIEVRTPRGGSVKTFLPLNVRFFWPNATI